MFSCELCEISHNTFFKNSSDGCFWINTRSVYCPTMTFHLLKHGVTYIFWLSILSAWFVGWEQKWAQYLKLLARSLFSTQSNIWDGAFLAKIVNSLTSLGRSSILDVQPRSKCASKQPLEGVVKWKTKTWENFIILGNFVHCS